MIYSRVIGLLLASLMLSGCGYHFGQGSLPSCYHSICVPYVIGDRTGALTEEIVKELSISGAFRYRTGGADLILKTELVDVNERNIGFRYERNKRGERIHTIIPAETRIDAVAIVSVIDACSGAVLLGPVEIVADVEFDHDYYFTQNSENIFSLGQLTDYDAAYDAAQTPLNKALAKKIVDYVIYSW